MEYVLFYLRFYLTINHKLCCFAVQTMDLVFLSQIDPHSSFEANRLLCESVRQTKGQLLTAVLNGNVEAKATLFDSALDYHRLNNKAHCAKWGDGLCTWASTLGMCLYADTAYYQKHGWEGYTSFPISDIPVTSLGTSQALAVEWFAFILAADGTPFTDSILRKKTPTLVRELAKVVIAHEQKRKVNDGTVFWSGFHHRHIFTKLVSIGDVETLDQYLTGMPFLRDHEWSDGDILSPKILYTGYFNLSVYDLARRDRLFRAMEKKHGYNPRRSAVNLLLCQHLIRLHGVQYFLKLLTDKQGREAFFRIIVHMDPTDFAEFHRITGIPFSFVEFRMALDRSLPVLSRLVAVGFPRRIISAKQARQITCSVLSPTYKLESDVELLCSYRTIVQRIRQLGFSSAVDAELEEHQIDYQNRYSGQPELLAGSLAWLDNFR